MTQSNGTTNGETRRIRVAIIGGGMAGISLAVALKAHKHIDAQLFEGADELTERGAGVGFASNATRAMSMIDPELREALNKAGATPRIPSIILMLGSGEYAEVKAYDTAIEPAPVSVARYEFLKEMLKLIPSDTTHVKKKLIAINEDTKPDGAIEIEFADGTKHVCDAVIGADGIHSLVRNQVLGEGHKALVPKYSGTFAYWTIVPAKEAREKLGDKFFMHDTQTGWAGDGGLLMHDFVNNGESMQVIVAVSKKDWPHDQMWAKVPEDETREVFKDWSPWCQSFVEYIISQPDIGVLGLFEHEHAPAYTKGRICVTGDAAHAHTPWQGAGAGQAFEDSLLLQHLLGVARTPRDIALAFQVFDKYRRPRTQEVAEGSRAMGKALTGSADIKLVPEDVKGYMEHAWDYIHDYDLTGMCNSAVTDLQKEIAAAA